MSEFNNMNIRKLDLTLLLVFEAAMDGGKLTVAAKRLGLTQSAVSHALKRLREIFDDALFVRTTHGVRPTRRALALRAPLLEALHLIAGTVQAPSFDPARDHRVFRIAAPDYESSLFAPLLTRSIRSDLRSQFIFRPLLRKEAIEGLKSGEVELILGYTWERDKDCETNVLYEEEYRVVARQGHAIFTKPLDLERYTSFGHVLVSPGGSITGIVDRMLAKAGQTRHVAVAVPYFLAALATVARSDLIATLPRRLVDCHAKGFAVQGVPPPVQIRNFPVSMAWSRRLGVDPGIVWLRNEILASTKNLQTM